MTSPVESISRAERRCGEMLRESAEDGTHATQRRHGKGIQASVMLDDTRPTLPALGISRNQSSRWQRLASMPVEHFETAVTTAKEVAGEVTTAFLLRQADTDAAVASAFQKHEVLEATPALALLPVWPVLPRSRQRYASQRHSRRTGHRGALGLSVQAVRGTRWGAPASCGAARQHPDHGGWAPPNPCQVATLQWYARRRARASAAHPTRLALPARGVGHL
jgi:hypothetical protein